MGKQLLFKTKTSYSLKPVRPTVHYVGFPPCLRKQCEILFVILRTRYGLSLVFRLSLVSSKFKFSAVIQLFVLKTTSHGKPGLKNSFLRLDLRHGKVQGEAGVQGTPVFQEIPVPPFSRKTTSHYKSGLKFSRPSIEGMICSHATFALMKFSKF